MRTERRVCSHRNCKTVLASSNPGPTCWNHTDYRIGGIRYVSRRGVMSEEFRRGIRGGQLTPAEQTAYWTGEWIAS